MFVYAQHAPFEDPVAEKLLDRIRTGFNKRFGRHIEGIDASRYKENARFHELCAFLGLELEEDQVEGGDHSVDNVDPPEDDEERLEVESAEAVPSESEGKHAGSILSEVESGSEDGCVNLSIVLSVLDLTSP